MLISSHTTIPRAFILKIVLHILFLVFIDSILVLDDSNVYGLCCV
jgi:hypothetical protein